MIHAVSITEDLPLLHLAKGDVILVELDAHDPVVLYRPLPANYAAILPILIDQGAATSSLTRDALASLSSLSEPPPTAASLVPRSGTDRRQGQPLRLVVE
jgi:hypothetical protein